MVAQQKNKVWSCPGNLFYVSTSLHLLTESWGTYDIDNICDFIVSFTIISPLILWGGKKGKNKKGEKRKSLGMIKSQILEG